MIPVVLVPSRIRTSTLAGSEQAAVALGSVPSHSSDCFPVSTQRYRTPSSSGERVVLAYRSSSRRRRHRRDALAQSQTSEPEASRWRCSGSGLLGDSFAPLCRFTCKVSHSARTVDRLSPQRPVRFRLQGQACRSAPQEVTLRRTAPSTVKNGSSSTRWTGGHDVRLWPPASTSFDDRQLSDELGRKRLTPFDCVDQRINCWRANARHKSERMVRSL